MEHIFFYKDFKFRTITVRRYSHTDNSKGINCHFLARMLHGHGRIVTEQKEVLELHAGDVFYLPRGLRYHSYWYGDPEVSWESYAFTDFPRDPRKSYRMQVLHPDAEAILHLNALSPNTALSCSSIGHLFLLLDQLLPTMEEDHADSKQIIFERVTDYISSHLDFKVSELARHCGMSESGLYAFLQKNANTTPIDIKNRIKTERAVELLQSTDLFVEEISDRLGFCNTAYFRKVLRLQTGKTPSDIRREAKLI
ncbi:MAG: helix-turn-helix transcriptional regulator [Clostridia bacterium]|nr:helix-turn-helix transcriptional regulator [Clostridia bacterium]